MRTMSPIVIRALLLSLMIAPLLQAQSGQRNQQRPVPGQAPPLVPAFGGQLDGPTGVQVLSPRELQDHPLEERDQKRYDATITGMERRSAATAQTGSRTVELAAMFRLASTQLRNGQELAALDSYEKAWQVIAELCRDSKTAMAAIGQIRPHLRELQTVGAKDLALALTLMSELAPAHQLALEAIEQPRTREQFAQLLAQTWSQFMLAGQLEKDSLGKAARWVLLFPQLALADRPLAPEQQALYQSQLTQVNVMINQQLRHLAERQLGQPQQVFPGNNTPETVDPVVAQAIALLDAKRGPISRFIEADVHLQFGQFRDGLAATNMAWRELLEFYRSNPRSVTPADSQVHFETMKRLAATNPIQALAILDQVDPLYRTVLAVDRSFGVRLADMWAELAADLPLSPPMLTKAAAWMEHVSKQHKDMEARYAAALERIKRDLDPDGQPATDSGRPDAEQPGADDQQEPSGVGGRRGLTIPRSVDHNRHLQDN
jgi:hypothetical protein